MKNATKKKLGIFTALLLASLRALAVDDAWQASAMGLRDGCVTPAVYSLMLRVSSQDNVLRLVAPGGARTSSKGAYTDYLPFSLGEFSMTDSPGLSSAVRGGDWSASNMTATMSNSAVMTFYASQASPGVAINTTSDNIVLFKNAAQPAYIAVPNSGAGMTVYTTPCIVPAPPADQPWILAWWGNASTFNRNENPLNCGRGTLNNPFGDDMPWGGWGGSPLGNHKADCPLMIVFGKNPSVTTARATGLEMVFSGGGNRLAVYPIAGRPYLKASDTALWNTGVPSVMEQRCRANLPFFKKYPVSVREGFKYNAGTDEAVFTETASFLDIGSGGRMLAPIPPVATIAMDMGLSASTANVVSLGIPTDYGYVWGVPGVAGSTWTIKGLSTYVNYTQPAGVDAGSPAAARTELGTKVAAMSAAGLLRPFQFNGEYYWGEPAEELYLLANVYPVLDATGQTTLKNYMTTIRQNRPPETLALIPWDSGTDRGWWSNTLDHDDYNRISTQRNTVALFSLYGLSRYYQVAGGSPDTASWNNCKTVLANSFIEQGWSTMHTLGNQDHSAFNTGIPRTKYWRGERFPMIVEINRKMAGAMGAVRLAKLEGDTASEEQAWWMLARMSVLRYSLGKYAQWRYRAGLCVLPANPAWNWDWVASIIPWQRWTWASLENKNWASPADDVRQVIMFGQDHVELETNQGMELEGSYSSREGASQLLPYRYVTPETGLFLANNLEPEISRYIDCFKFNLPYSYLSFSRQKLGLEDDMHFPSSMHETVVCESRVLDRTAAELYDMRDIPYVNTGDLFYMNRLAETLRVKTPGTGTKLIAGVNAPPQSAASRITCAASPARIGAEGTSESTVVAYVCDQQGNLVPDSSVPVTFSASGAQGTLLGQTQVNAVAGTAKVTFRAGTSAGTAVVHAASSGLQDGTASIKLVANHQPNGSVNLQCDGQTDPVGIANMNPVFTWTFSDVDPEETQSSYRVLVASTQANINANTGNMWDSSEVVSTLGFARYAGAQLQANTVYYWKVQARSSLGTMGPFSSVATFAMNDVDPRALYGLPFNIPGKIECEDYNLGGEGSGYHDTESGHPGGMTQTYRVGDGADILACVDTGGGFNLCYTQMGEWYDYLVNVPTAGTYRLDARVASGYAGGKFHVSFNGVDKTGQMQIPDTGWTTYTTITAASINLSAGRQIMRITIDANHSRYADTAGQLNWISITDTVQTPPAVTVISPNGGGTFTAGSSVNVQWTSSGAVGNLNIDITTSNGSSWSSLAANTLNDGNQSVALPVVSATGCRIRVQEADGIPTDQSDGTFSIVLPVVPVLSVSPASIDLGAVTAGSTLTRELTISNAGSGTLSGTLSGNAAWLSLGAASFNGNSSSITVTVDTTGLTAGSASSVITVNSNGGSAAVPVTLTVNPVPPPPPPPPPPAPVLALSTDTLNFGVLAPSDDSALEFVITNAGNTGQVLSGTITADSEWIIVSPRTYSGNNVVVNVRIDAAKLMNFTGNYTGLVTVTSQAGSKTVLVTLEATCVLVKPSPVSLSGRVDGGITVAGPARLHTGSIGPDTGPTGSRNSALLTFFGSGIVPGNTAIRIYTLSGELVAVLPSNAAESQGGIGWDGVSVNGEMISPGIYIYTYVSSVERGTGKFTVVR